MCVDTNRYCILHTLAVAQVLYLHRQSYTVYAGEMRRQRQHHRASTAIPGP
jgi:hypothetical protein